MLEQTKQRQQVTELIALWRKLTPLQKMHVWAQVLRKMKNPEYLKDRVARYRLN